MKSTTKLIIQRKTVWVVFALVSLVCIFASAQAKGDERLLTKTEKGSYFAVPSMNEKSSFSSPISFSKGRLTTGKKSFVPFIGVYSGDKLKSPERLRHEIRIAGQAGNGTVMLAFDDTFAKHPDLAQVVAEEFKSEK